MAVYEVEWTVRIPLNPEHTAEEEYLNEVLDEIQARLEAAWPSATAELEELHQ